MTAQAGVGKDNYNWWMKNVQLVQDEKIEVRRSTTYNVNPMAVEDDAMAVPTPAQMEVEHMLWPLPRHANCPTCRLTRLKETPARRHRDPEYSDPRCPTERFGDVVDIDTLFLNQGDDEMVQIADPQHVQNCTLILQTIRDRHTKDIDCLPVPNRGWRGVRDSLIEFGETHNIFTRPKEKRTEDYVTGRFG